MKEGKMMKQLLEKERTIIIKISGFALLLGLLLGRFGLVEDKQILLILATFLAGIPILYKAIQSLRVRSLTIELLVSIAVIGALFIGEYTESAVVTFLFLFGEYLEKRTLEKTRSSIKDLIDLVPKEAMVIRENGEKEQVPIANITEGDKIAIHSGGSIPIDGSVVSGEAFVNEATITGESTPTSKSINSTVYSGTIVDSGYIEVQAEKIGADTTFAKIIEIVEEAQDSKSKMENFLDRFATIYTPAIVFLSIIVFLVFRDIRLSITFLVIACPGALVIGVPVSNVAGIGNGAKNGVLIKGGEILDRLSRIDTVVFDKTGTLTIGRPEVSNIRVVKGKWEEVLYKTASAEMLSEHPLGKAIVRKATKEGLTVSADTVQNGKIVKGKGLTALIHEDKLVIGNRKLMEEHSIVCPPDISQYALEQEKIGSTVVFSAINKEIAAVMTITDTIRKDAKQAIQDMRANSLFEMVMLTGDNVHAANSVANELELDNYYAELLPEEKVEHITELKESGRKVMMVGDGINDAPAIASADIGIAMGEGGTDVSMETADVVLMADQLQQLSHAYALSKATVSNAKQNVLIAILTVGFLLAGVLLGNVHLASGMLIHELSVLFVIINATRLIRFNRKNRNKFFRKFRQLLPAP